MNQQSTKVWWKTKKCKKKIWIWTKQKKKLLTYFGKQARTSGPVLGMRRPPGASNFGTNYWTPKYRSMLNINVCLMFSKGKIYALALKPWGCVFHPQKPHFFEQIFWSCAEKIVQSDGVGSRTRDLGHRKQDPTFISPPVTSKNLRAGPAENVCRLIQHNTASNAY